MLKFVRSHAVKEERIKLSDIDRKKHLVINIVKRDEAVVEKDYMKEFLVNYFKEKK